MPVGANSNHKAIRNLISIINFTFCLLCILYFFLLGKLWLGLKKLPVSSNQQLQLVTVIVAARNEEKKICQCLNSLVNQNYPKNWLEILVVDDGSTDSTLVLLEQYKNSYDFFGYLRTCHFDQGNKKRALTAAIEKSAGQLLLFTDADCIPQKNWVRSLVSYFDANVGVVAGFSPLIDPTNSLLGNILALDSLAANFVAAGAIGQNSAATCTGRNLAYRREVFFQLHGFEEIEKSLSGDDDLFLQLVKRKTKWRIRFAMDKDSIVTSFQTKKLIDFFKQKKRHLSASKFYSPKIKLYYLLFHLANWSFFVFFAFTIFSLPFLPLFATSLFIKIVIDWLLLTMNGKKFDLTFTFSVFVVWELFFVLYHFLITPISWFGKLKWQ